MDRYKQLTDDLKEAKEKAEQQTELMNDEGRANNDYVFLRLPRWFESKVIPAIEAAGFQCEGKVQWIGYGYLITPPEGIGTKRSKQAIIIKDYLVDLGYDCDYFIMGPE